MGNIISLVIKNNISQMVAIFYFAYSCSFQHIFHHLSQNFRCYVVYFVAYIAF